jgi:hypothetical protein
MILHPDGSMMLHHFIAAEHLVTMLEKEAFHLIRQDTYPNDGKLPDECFTKPYRGALERSLGLEDEFLVSQAHAVDSLRHRTFIMSWTHDPSPAMRAMYGKNGLRCEIQASARSVKAMLGYSWPGRHEFPPRDQIVSEIPGGTTTAELKLPVYSDGIGAISVVPSTFATGHKTANHEWEAEARIAASVLPYDLEVLPEHTIIQWKAASFHGLTVALSPTVSAKERACIVQLAAFHEISVRQ